MAVSLYTTTVIAGVRKEIIKFTPYLTRLCCPNVLRFTTQTVSFDRIFQDNSLAPYVSPLVAGTVNEKDGYITESIKPPYIKDLDQVLPSDGVDRLPGEGIGGTLSPDVRIRAERVRLIKRHTLRLIRRVEEQVSQLVCKGGKVICEGDGSEPLECNYNMSDSNDIQLVGPASWNNLDPESKADCDKVYEDLVRWFELAEEGVGRVTFSKEAWSLFAKFCSNKDSMLYRLLDTTVKNGTMNIDMAPNSSADLEQFKGVLGSVELYVYKGYYTKGKGRNKTRIMFLDAGRLFLTPNNVGGAVCYGAIQDVHELKAVTQFTKNWISEDPSCENIMSQSAPIAAVPNINSIVTINVISE